MSNQHFANLLDIELIESKATVMDREYIKTYAMIRSLRLKQGRLIWHLKRKPEGCNEGDEGYNPEVAAQVKFLYQYVDGGIYETWAQYCEDPRRPSRMSAYKYEQIYRVFILEQGYDPDELVECSLDRLYTALRRAGAALAENGTPDWHKEAIDQAAILTDDDWEVWLWEFFGTPAPQPPKAPSPTFPIVEYGKPYDLRQGITIPANVPANRMMRVTVEPASQIVKPVDEISAVLNMCDRVIRQFVAGEIPNPKEVQVVLAALETIKALEALQHEGQ